MPKEKRDFQEIIQEKLASLPELTEMDLKIGEFRFLFPLIQESEDLEKLANLAREITYVTFEGDFKGFSKTEQYDYFVIVADSFENTPEDKVVVDKLLELIGQMGRVRAVEAFNNRKR